MLRERLIESILPQVNEIQMKCNTLPVTISTLKFLCKLEKSKKRHLQNLHAIKRINLKNLV